MYTKREIIPLSHAVACGLTWKRYFIRATPETDGLAIIAASERILKLGNYKEPYSLAVDVGFCVIHAGMDMDFLLFGYWVNGNELILKVYKSLPGDSDNFVLTDTNAQSFACVWDIAVISHERNAFVTHLLTADNPGRNGYMNDFISGFW